MQKASLLPQLSMFGKGVSKKELQVVHAFCSQVRSFLSPEQQRNTPRNFDMKRLFRNAFSQHSKRSEKECEERSSHRVPGPCSQAHPFLLAEVKGYPQELRHETPYPERLFRTPERTL